MGFETKKGWVIKTLDKYGRVIDVVGPFDNERFANSRAAQLFRQHAAERGRSAKVRGVVIQERETIKFSVLQRDSKASVAGMPGTLCFRDRLRQYIGAGWYDFEPDDGKAIIVVDG